MLDLCDLVYVKLICCKLYIVISMFIVYVNLCMCMYVIYDCV
jgi:hypothetical protein